jgi:hypothetical protein
MTFLGWELSTGEVVSGYWKDEEGKTKITQPTKDDLKEHEYEFIRVPQHQANDLRSAIGYKGRMKPRYA